LIDESVLISIIYHFKFIILLHLSIVSKSSIEDPLIDMIYGKILLATTLRKDGKQLYLMLPIIKVRIASIGNPIIKYIPIPIFKKMI